MLELDDTSVHAMRALQMHRHNLQRRGKDQEGDTASAVRLASDRCSERAAGSGQEDLVAECILPGILEAVGAAGDTQEGKGVASGSRSPALACLVAMSRDTSSLRSHILSGLTQVGRRSLRYHHFATSHFSELFSWSMGMNFAMVTLSPPPFPSRSPLSLPPLTLPDLSHYTFLF